METLPPVCFSGPVLPDPRVRQACRPASAVVAMKSTLSRRTSQPTFVSSNTNATSTPEFPTKLAQATIHSSPYLTWGRGGEGVNSPLKCPKNNRGRHDMANIPPTREQILFVHRQRDPAREPEYHRHRIEAQDGILVR